MESYPCRVQSADELDVKSVFDCQELTVILALNSAKLSHVAETSNRMLFCVVVAPQLEADHALCRRSAVVSGD